MNTSGQVYQSAHELGRIYDAISDSKILIEFFLNTVPKFISAKQGYLFLAGKNQSLWLEASQPFLKETCADLKEEVRKSFEAGKPSAKGRLLFLPVIARNTSLGIACFERGFDLPAFDSREVELGFDLASQFSGALKNILLFEENLRMERLAAVGQAMGMVLHEIKNILQLAKFSDELIRIGIQEKKESFLEKGLAKMAKTLREMDGLTREMLSLTKDYQLQPEKVNLPAMLEELKNDLAENAASHQVRLDFSAEIGFPIIEGDGHSIYRALLNLVKNAFEAFQEKSDACIKIRAQIPDVEHYQLIVEDNASGMSEEVRARLFEAFFSTKGKHGTGLGLMVVARTVKMHQGKIHVESEFGKGTRFILTLPRELPKNSLL